MFTGLIEEIGRLRRMDASGDGVSLVIESRAVLEGTRVGDSISVDGVCLTVSETGKDYFIAFASRVTVSLTTLGKMQAGSSINLERALAAGDRMGGHIVQGHVDGTGMIDRVVSDENGIEMTITLEADLAKYIVPKGSVAVDGISLTAVEAGLKSFKLYLIPETLKKTALSSKKKGDRVNIETDIIGKYVERFMGNREESNTQEKNEKLKRILMDEGYV